jgi:hypothetical protein
VVYFFVFGAGTFYIAALMYKPPAAADDSELQSGPLRTAGITPAAQGEGSSTWIIDYAFIWAALIAFAVLPM